MGLCINSQLKVVKGKFLKCLHSLELCIDFSADALDENYIVGAANYDPITSELWDQLYSEFLTEKVNVYYLDIDSAIVVRSEVFSLEGAENEISLPIIEQHILHYNGAVEGSYFAIDEQQSWAVFYDALEDIFLLHTKDPRGKERFSDYLFSD